MIEFNLDHAPTPDPRLSPFGVRTMKVRVTSDAGAPALRIRPKGVRPADTQAGIFRAFDPSRALVFLLDYRAVSLVVLGGVFLAVTGAEALYADMGHLGRRPIQIAWIVVVFPALVLNYLGQGAFLLAHPDALHNPFFRMVPDWALVPLIGIATIVTVIASQATISGAYSVARQAVQLGLLPRLNFTHTSESEHGQVYAPQVNILLYVGVFALVAGFRSSSNLASAYGISVNAAMIIDGVMGTVLFWRCS